MQRKTHYFPFIALLSFLLLPTIFATNCSCPMYYCGSTCCSLAEYNHIYPMATGFAEGFGIALLSIIGISVAVTSLCTCCKKYECKKVRHVQKKKPKITYTFEIRKKAKELQKNKKKKKNKDTKETTEIENV
uniref:uncharacterized protein LOC120326917 n=1 Tax=Styela clava TaxID=7725 RepID=UPI00193A2CF7|nr:uncharacterized protein LOC120326917 [Styela clava]